MSQKLTHESPLSACCTPPWVVCAGTPEARPDGIFRSCSMVLGSSTCIRSEGIDTRREESQKHEGTQRGISERTMILRVLSQVRSDRRRVS